MPATIPIKRQGFFNNVGGIHDAAAVTEVKTYEAVAIRNVDLTPTGRIQKTPGYYVVNTTSIIASSPITGIHHYRRWSGNDSVVVTLNSSSAASAAIYVRDAGTTTFTSITPSSGFTGGNVTFAQNNDLLIFAADNSSQELLSWNGSASVCVSLASASAPIGGSVADYKNHLMVMDVPVRLGNVEFSHLGDPNSWRNQDRIAVDRPTIGGTTLKEWFCMFTTERIIRFSGDDRDNFRQETMNDSVGADSPIGIVNAENVGRIIWPWRGKFYEFDGSNTRVISNKLGRMLDGTSEHWNINLSAFDSIQGVNLSQERRAVFLVRESGASTSFFLLSYWYELRTPDPKEHDFNVGAWTLEEYDRAFSSIGVVLENGEEVLYAGTNDGQLCRLYIGNRQGDSSANADDGSAYSSRYQSGPFYDKRAEETKRWREFLVMIAQAGNFNIQVDFAEDFAGSFSGTTQINLATAGFSSLWGSAVWNTGVWGSAVTLQRRVQTGFRSEALSIRISDNSTNPPWRVDGWALMYQSLPGLRRF